MTARVRTSTTKNSHRAHALANRSSEMSHPVLVVGAGLANVKHLSGGIDSISVSYIEVTHTGGNRPGNSILRNLLWRD